MARIVSIRRRLLSNIVVLVVLLGGSILAATFFGNRATVRALSTELIERVRDQTRTRLEGFFDPVLKQLHVLEEQRSAGLLDLEDPRAVNAALAPILAHHPQVSSLLLANSQGQEHMLLRIGSSWRARRTDVERWGRKAMWLEWTNDAPTVRERDEDLGYDTRTRPWFQGAVARLALDGWSKRVSWTTPYTFFTTKEPGITASIAHRDAEGTIHVVGLDVLLRDISVFTTSLVVSEHGSVAVVEQETSEVLGLPRTALFLTDEGRQGGVRKQLADLDVPVLTDAVAAWPTESADGVGEATPYRFRNEGTWWWGGVTRYALSPERVLRILVVVPESDLLGGLSRMRWLILGLVMLVLAGAGWRAYWLADRFSDPIEALVHGSDRIAKGDLEQGVPIESDVREVQKLAQAQERMRGSLQALMKLERDLQVARQIQQGTLPDILPGLKGFEVEGWSEPADETGGDTYDVIGLTGEWAHASIVASEQKADRAVLMLADATGHGIGPALSALQLRAMLRMAMRMGGDLETIAKHMNAQLCEDLPSARFITTWLGMLDPGRGTLRTFSAGQAPLLHYHASTDTADLLPANAPPFGILPTIPIVIGEPVALAPGDLYIVLSDGIYEAQDPEGAKFGDDRVVGIVRAHRHDTPREILQAIRTAVETFARGRPADDDRTAVIIKRL